MAATWRILQDLRMIDESMDVEQMKQPPQPYEFRSKSRVRLLIMLGGVVQLHTSLVIYAGVLYTWGEPSAHGQR